MTPIKVAVVGTGFFSQFHYEAWTRIPEVSLAALAYASDTAKADRVAAKYGVPRAFSDVEEMLDVVRPDLVDIVSPPETHLSLVECAAARGAAVVTQKPLAPSLAEAAQIAALGHDTTVVVHDNWRFKPWFREARRLLDGGELGELYGLTFRLRPGDGQGERAYLDRQPYFQRMPRFLVHETGIHLIDVFRFLAGEIDAVTARLRRLNPVIAGEDAGHVVVDFASGAGGLIDGNRLVDFEATDPRRTMGELVVEGSSGQLRLAGDGSLTLRAQGGVSREHPYEWADRGYGGDCVYRLQRHVVDHLLHGAPLENSVGSYLRNVQVEEAVYSSSATGRRVTVDEIRRR